MQNLDCGLTSINEGSRITRRTTGRIIGGNQVIPHSFPWQVLLNGLGRFCGGKIFL